MNAICFSGSFADWRDLARSAVIAQLPPDQIVWACEEERSLLTSISLNPAPSSLRMPRRFLEQAEVIALHSSSQKWALLYQALWRIHHGERHLLELAADPLTRELQAMDKAVRRDAYKAQAFVRFREVPLGDELWQVAWHEPEHNILKLVFPFFRDRFTNVKWSILTPWQCVYWDTLQEVFTPGIPKQNLPEDDVENLWVRYYETTFNPARLKLKAMQAQMQKKYWKNLPEAASIPALIRRSTEI